MRIKIIAAALAAVCLALTACSLSDSSSQTVQEIMSGVNEKNGGENDSSAALPEAVSLDSERMSELSVSADGRLICEQVGASFELPSDFKAYYYSVGDISPKEYEESVNPSCTDSLFLISPYFPQVCEYVRVCTDRLISAEILPFEKMKETEKGLKKEEYLRRVKNDIKYNADYFKAFENADMYNYIGAKKRDGYPQTGTPDIGASYNTVMFTTITAMREQAPDSEISDISCEETELDNGAFGLRFDYTLKRNGIKAKKEVYWLFIPGQTLMRRIEFTTDKSGKASFDTKAFLEGIEFSAPKLSEDNIMYGYEQAWQDDT